MARPKRPAVQRYHDRVAGRYDASYDDQYWRWHDALTWDYLKPYLPRDQTGTVLDLGCGTGKWAAKLVKSGFRVACVDISAKMLDQARAKIDAMGASSRATFIHADLCDLSAIENESASTAVALGDPIGCAGSPLRALKEIRRVLAGGGVLVATFDNKLSAIEYYLEQGDARELARFLRDGRTHWLTKDPDERFEISTFAPDELRQLIEGAGFELLEMVGKTVLPMRHNRVLLAESDSRRAWARIERSLCRNSFALARASHLQIACRKNA